MTPKHAGEIKRRKDRNDQNQYNYQSGKRAASASVSVNVFLNDTVRHFTILRCV
jgi:hypothetical protein